MTDYIDQNTDRLIQRLISNARTIHEGRYNELQELFDFTKESKYPRNIVDLAEAFGLMAVKLEAREYNLEQMISSLKNQSEELKILNEQLEESNRTLEDKVKERTKELHSALDQLKELDRLKSSFLTMVSHELRTPLTSVIGFAKIAHKKLDDIILPRTDVSEKKTERSATQVLQNLDIIVSEGERLTDLINDFLDLSKMEAGKFNWKKEMFMISDLVDQATAATASLVEQKGLLLRKDIETGLPMVSVDGSRIIQVLINLISNAIKFTDKGEILCRAVLDNNEVVVSVSDTGIGIAAGDMPKIFEKFRQVDDTLRNSHKGTGLGLPICKKIVENHKGRIWVESKPGEGSTFYFSIPAASSESDTIDN